MSETFRALVARENEDGKAKAAVEQADDSLLAAGDVTVRVAFSGINYKDALGVCNKGKIFRALPIIPGIDYAGEVEHSDSAEFKRGDSVALTGWGVGEKHSGGWAQKARAQASWLLPLPQGLDARQAMRAGTAGLTAALCVDAILQSGRAGRGDEAVVSGASGGVGSFAVALLAAQGFKVTAVSRPAAADYLTALGAAEIIPREEMTAPKPLEAGRWKAAVDAAGGEVLAKILSQSAPGGVVAACGLAAGFALQTTVMPLILRGVRLEGVDSVMASNDRRRAAWQLLSELDGAVWKQTIAGETSLEDAPARCAEILGGEKSGRFLVTPE